MTNQDRFLCGLGLGVAAGILFAPRAGSKTRGMISKSAKEGQARLERKSNEVLDSVVDAIDRGNKAAQQTAEGIAQALEAGKRRLVG
jgi:gas vesicle protein